MDDDHAESCEMNGASAEGLRVREPATDARLSWLAAAAEDLEDAVIGEDEAGVVVAWNRGAERLFGYRAGETEGRLAGVLVPSGLEHEAASLTERARRGERIKDFETQRRTGDGRLVSVSLSVSPVLGPSGRVVGITTVVRETTRPERPERPDAGADAGADVRALEARLREVEGRYRSLAEQLPAVVYIQQLGESGEAKPVSYVNPRLKNMLGYSPEEEMADPELWIRALHPEDRERVLAEDEKTDHTNEPFRVEYRQLAKDGEYRWIRDEAIVVRDDAGTPMYWQGVQFDITEGKRAEEALRRQAEDLARSNAELEQFAYVASHDLQEPLRMISSYTQLLARRYGSRLDEDADEFISYAVDGADRMRALINDLLRYSRVGTHGKEFAPVACDEVFEAALANLRVAIEESGAEVASEPLPKVMGDEVQLLQLFQNLIGNAIKFRGEEAPRVSVRIERLGRFWRFSVMDNGIGMDPRYADRIFTIFQRLHARDEYLGTGIGLAICKKIAGRHGGEIWAESTGTPGEGSVFYFTLPIVEPVEEQS